jgi:hypothetical protein
VARAIAEQLAQIRPNLNRPDLWCFRTTCKPTMKQDSEVVYRHKVTNEQVTYDRVHRSKVSGLSLKNATLVADDGPNTDSPVFADLPKANQ